MANNTQSGGQQGTGKHPHKSEAEPYPHTKDGEGASAGRKSGQGAESSRQQTGGELSSQGGRSEGGKSEGAKGATQGDDLKAREYRDADGEVHHHTKAYMEQHKNDK